MVRPMATADNGSGPNEWQNLLAVFHFRADDSDLKASRIAPRQSEWRFLRQALVLLVADLLHPVDGLSVELFLNRDVRHGRCWRGAMPMLLTRRDPDHVAGPNFLDRAAPALYAAAASSHDQMLAQRVGVPCCPSAGLERDTASGRTCRIICLEKRVEAYGAGKILGRSLAGRL